ncbi:PREDICTED: estradiol 17-beta-dehydrogenase 11-like [Sturnus vulgaris]|uniref:estradiol 17-beta-dehydrogenase 11-like n=1 Tax=Sturnus vulgaris TaxID=9172 RepID=UPI00071AAD31|nr:PREDICTED: estradiol 17-beta-dehydrogenase 11-like [Sturnus vulgaris]
MNLFVEVLLFLVTLLYSYLEAFVKLFAICSDRRVETGFLTSHLFFFSSCSSSKFAAVGFHKALTEELAALGKDGIKTTCLCPVFINTGFVKNPSARLGKILEVEEVVETLMEGIVTNQKMVFVPPQLNIALLSELVFPERALNLLKKMTTPKFDAVIGQRSSQ